MSVRQVFATESARLQEASRSRAEYREQVYDIEIARTEEHLRALEPEWTRLYVQSRPRNPFVSYEWAMACWHHLCTGAEPFIVTARTGGRLVGVAPLRLERHFGLRVLRFIGKG